MAKQLTIKELDAEDRRLEAEIRELNIKREYIRRAKQQIQESCPHNKTTSLDDSGRGYRGMCQDCYKILI